MPIIASSMVRTPHIFVYPSLTSLSQYKKKSQRNDVSRKCDERGKKKLSYMGAGGTRWRRLLVKQIKRKKKKERTEV